MFAINFWFVLLAYFAQFCFSTFRHVRSIVLEVGLGFIRKTEEEKNEAQILKILLHGGCGGGGVYVGLFFHQFVRAPRKVGGGLIHINSISI